MANNTSHYQLPVVDTISTAWDKVSGAKGSVWAAIVILFVIMFVLGFVQGIFENVSHIFAMLLGLVFSIVNLLLQIGLIYIGIARAFNKPISYRLMFNTFNTTTALNIVGVYILKFLIILVPAILIILAVIMSQAGQSTALAFLIGLVGVVSAFYLSIRLFVAIGYVLDKGLGPVAAIKMSFKATRGNVLNLLGLAILQICIFIIAAIPLGIGLIWAIPLGLIIYGTVYKRLSSN
jgi:hypothetical protein